MSNAAKVWLIIAGVLTALGILIFVGALAMCNWNFSNFSNAKFTTKTYEVNETFDNISIDIPTSDIIFAAATDGKCKVECYDSEKAEYAATVQENTLTVTVKEEKTSWIERISLFSFESPKITVYLPENEYKQLSITTSTGNVDLPAEFSFAGIDINGSTSNVNCSASAVEDLTIRSTTGDISLSALSAGKIDIEVTTGDVRLQGVSAQSGVSIKTTTGDITLIDTICENNLTLEGVTCDIVFDKSDAVQITAKTTTGDITGTLCSDKSFVTNSTSGDVDIPNPCEGGKCELTTTTGDIHIRIVESDRSVSTADSAAKDE